MIIRKNLHFLARSTLALLLFACAMSGARAIEIVGANGQILTQSPFYVRHDRFVSGYIPASGQLSGPLAGMPVANTDPSFIAAGYDLSGIGWNANNIGSLVTMLNGRYFLFAAHRTPSDDGSTIQFLTSEGTLHESQIAWNSGKSGSPTYLSLGDIGIGKFTESIPDSAGVASYRILDVGLSTNIEASTTALFNRPMLLFGKYGMVGYTEVRDYAGSVNGVNLDGPYGPYILFKTRFAGVQQTPEWAGWVSLNEQGDSGSPGFFMEGGELLLAGTSWSLDSTSLVASPVVVPKLNTIMAADGYVLQYTIGDSVFNRTFKGGGASLNDANNYLNGLPHGDASLIFKGDEAEGSRNLSMGGALSTRGIVFRDSASDRGFTIGNDGTLSVGYTGIRNLSQAEQIIHAPVKLMQHQSWETEGGDLRFTGAVDKNGYLLFLAGKGAIRLEGKISGAGGLAKDDSGRVYLDSATGNDYSGTTWVHNGMLSVNNTSNSGTGSGAVIVERGGILAGLGRITGRVEIQEGGFIAAGREGMDDVGTLVLNGTFSLAGTIHWNLNANSETTGFDLIRKTNVLTGVQYFDTADLQLSFGSLVDFHDDFWREERSWTILDLVDNSFVAGAEVWQDWKFQNEFGVFQVETFNGAGHDLMLLYTPFLIPEPSTAMLIAFAGMVLLYRRRKM